MPPSRDPAPRAAEPCLRGRLQLSRALACAIGLLALPVRNPNQDGQLLTQAHIAVECAVLASASRQDLPCLVADYILLRAMVVTGDHDHAAAWGCRLYRRAGSHPAIAAEVALLLAENAARAPFQALGQEHWSHLAAIASGLLSPNDPRRPDSARLRAVALAEDPASGRI